MNEWGHEWSDAVSNSLSFERAGQDYEPTGDVAGVRVTDDWEVERQDIDDQAVKMLEKACQAVDDWAASIALKYISLQRAKIGVLVCVSEPMCVRSIIMPGSVTMLRLTAVFAVELR